MMMYRGKIWPNTPDKSDFYISYNFSETAIVTKDNKFFILNGNYTDDYQKIITDGGGLKECLNFFKANEKHVSFWSSSP